MQPGVYRFLNTKGGYSFGFLRNGKLQETTKDQERIDRRGNPIDMGQSATWKLNVRSRVTGVHSHYVGTFKILGYLCVGDGGDC